MRDRMEGTHLFSQTKTQFEEANMKKHVVIQSLRTDNNILEHANLKVIYISILYFIYFLVLIYL